MVRGHAGVLIDFPVSDSIRDVVGSKCDVYNGSCVHPVADCLKCDGLPLVAHTKIAGRRDENDVLSSFVRGLAAPVDMSSIDVPSDDLEGSLGGFDEVC